MLNVTPWWKMSVVQHKRAHNSDSFRANHHQDWPSSAISPLSAVILRGVWTDAQAFKDACHCQEEDVCFYWVESLKLKRHYWFELQRPIETCWECPVWGAFGLHFAILISHILSCSSLSGADTNTCSDKTSVSSHRLVGWLWGLYTQKASPEQNAWKYTH